MQIKLGCLALLLFGANVFAQSGSTPAAGNAAAPSADASATAVPADTPAEMLLREKVQPQDELVPAVSIRQVGTSTVEEYRQSGRLYMVVVHPEYGPDYSFIDTNGDGRLESDPKDGPVTPVFFTLYRFK